MTGDDCHNRTGESGHRHRGEKVQRCGRAKEVLGEAAFAAVFLFQFGCRLIATPPVSYLLVQNFVYHRKEA